MHSGKLTFGNTWPDLESVESIRQSGRGDGFVEGEAILSGVDDIEVVESQVGFRDPHRFGGCRFFAVFELEPNPASLMENQEVQLGTRMRGPEIGIPVSCSRKNLLDLETLPRDPQFRVGFQRGDIVDVQQGVQDSAVPDVGFLQLWHPLDLIEDDQSAQPGERQLRIAQARQIRRRLKIKVMNLHVGRGFRKHPRQGRLPCLPRPGQGNHGIILQPGKNGCEIAISVKVDFLKFKTCVWYFKDKSHRGA